MVGGQSEYEQSGPNIKWQATFWSARTDTTGIALVLEPDVGPLDDGADAVSDGSDIGMAGGALSPSLAVPGFLESLVPAGIGVDDRDVAAASASGRHNLRPTPMLTPKVALRGPLLSFVVICGIWCRATPVNDVPAMPRC